MSGLSDLARAKTTVHYMVGSEWVCIQALLSRNEKERRDMIKFVSGERNVINIDSDNVYMITY